VLCDIPLKASGLKQDKGSTETTKEYLKYEDQSGNKFTMNIRFGFRFMVPCIISNMYECPT
jgi:hypothetical protein